MSCIDVNKLSNITFLFEFYNGSANNKFSVPQTLSVKSLSIDDIAIVEENGFSVVLAHFFCLYLAGLFYILIKRKEYPLNKHSLISSFHNDILTLEDFNHFLHISIVAANSLMHFLAYIVDLYVVQI